MDQPDDLLKGFNISLNAIDQVRAKLLGDLTPEQRKKYFDFETGLAELTKAGDQAGIEKLKVKFENELNND